VNDFENLLIRSGLNLLKYYLDISRGEQKRRLEDRRRDPLKQWKSSPVDRVALRHWRDYSAARDEMLLRTHKRKCPWIIVRADDKKSARLNVIRDILHRVECPDTSEHPARPDTQFVREFSRKLLKNGWIAR
jgi:polyphosphate kinase 2 (PPK2 family)